MAGIDYREVGLKVGLEWHQRLATRHKLFCMCPPEMRSEKPDITIERRLYATQSELGEVDRAAAFEQERHRLFIYDMYSDYTCEVEADESPPLPLNIEALEIALQIALMLRMEPVDEVHVMRKIVIDGSNTTGFQRTALVAVGTEDSYIETSEGRVRLKTLCLEEEAAYIEETRGEYARYRLDRLGIPLIEVATYPDIKSPKQAREVAEKIGLTFRMTGKVQRGIGTIRQDLNISIRDGARQEIKGVQELNLIPEVIEREVQRQLNLLRIREELKRRGGSPDEVKSEIVDVTDIFKQTSSKVVSKALRRGGKVLALLLPYFSGLLGFEIQPGRRFGSELASYARAYGGVVGIFHTDELPGYGVSEVEVNRVKEVVGASKIDAVVLVADIEEKARKALEAVAGRARYAYIGVPEETRRALPDGNTEYMRPLPGAARMYPETDIPPVQVTGEFLEKIRLNLPELPEQKVKRYTAVYGLGRELALQLVKSRYWPVFEELVEEHKGLAPKVIASTLVNTIPSLKREGVSLERIGKSRLSKVFALVEEDVISTTAIPSLLKAIANDPSAEPAKLVETLNLKLITGKELEKLIETVIAENEELIRRLGAKAEKKLMGKIMKKYRERVKGSELNQLLKRKLSEFLYRLKQS